MITIPVILSDSSCGSERGTAQAPVQADHVLVSTETRRAAREKISFPGCTGSAIFTIRFHSMVIAHKTAMAAL